MNEMIIDFHTHIGKELSGFSVSTKLLLSRMNAAGIGKSVVFPLNVDSSDCFRKGNDLVINACSNERFIGFMRINPALNQTMVKNEIERCVKEGLIGIKVHPNAQKFEFNIKNMRVIIELAEKYGLPILTHTGHKNDCFSDVKKIISVAKEFPKLNFISAHSRGGLSILAEALKELKNFYVDTSCITNHSSLIYLVRFGDFKKILFGSDFPFSLQEIEISKIRLCGPQLGLPQKDGLNSKERKAILGENALKLLS